MDASDLGAILLKMRQQTSECVMKHDATDFLGFSILLKYRNAS